MMYRYFESAQALGLRAKRHLSELGQEEDRYFRDSPPVRLEEFDAKIQRVVVKLAFREAVPIGYAVLVFEIVQCLRSALDHAVFDSARALGGSPKPKYTKFPFGLTKKAAENDLPRKAAEVPLAIRPYLIGFKPLRRGNRNLWALNELRNSKIHRSLTVMGAASQGTSFGDYVAITGLIFEPRSMWNHRKNELIVLRYLAAEGSHGEFNISCNIAFDRSTPFGGKAVFSTLLECFEMVDGIIKGIEAETIRLNQ